MTATSPNNSPSKSKVVVSTGATSGIGQIARDRTRGEAAPQSLSHQSSFQR